MLEPLAWYWSHWPGRHGLVDLSAPRSADAGAPASNITPSARDLNSNTPLDRNVQWFRGGLVSKAQRLCASLNSRLESNKEEEKSNRPFQVLDLYWHSPESGGVQSKPLSKKTISPPCEGWREEAVD